MGGGTRFLVVGSQSNNRRQRSIFSDAKLGLENYECRYAYYDLGNWVSQPYRFFEYLGLCIALIEIVT
jgi:hypothetical protein